MNISHNQESEIPIDIHTLKLQDWLISRRIVPKNIQVPIKEIRMKITNALKDMPSNEQLIRLLDGASINYYHVKEIIEILKQTEKETKSVFGSYGSQRMKDWQEILRLYEKNSIYLAETSQIYVRNVNFEIPGMRKQMTKLDQQVDECLKRGYDLNKPEAQLLSEHAQLLQQLGVKGDDLLSEFVEVLGKLPELYDKSIKDIHKLARAIDIYAIVSKQEQCLPILRHLIEYGNTTVYQYIHKEAPLAIDEPAIKLTLSETNTNKNNNTNINDIDFGIEDNGGTSSTVSAELIDFGEISNLENVGYTDISDSDANGNIDWGIESGAQTSVEINFDIPIEEYGIVVEGTGMDGGTARGDQAYTLLDSPNYRERFMDELYELQAFLQMRLHELGQLELSTNIMFSLMDNIATHHDRGSIKKILSDVEKVIHLASDEQMCHLFQLKHSKKYADLIATKLKQMSKAVEKLRTVRNAMNKRASELRAQRKQLNPLLDDLIEKTRKLQAYVENDISKRYKNRVVNLIGGVC